MKLSPDQSEALDVLQRWFSGSTPPVYETEYRNGASYTRSVGTAHDYPVLSVGGYAGTGKTTILREVAEEHKHAILVTPTHKAAQVLRSKLPAYVRARVQTFHSLIYTPDPKFTCGSSGHEMLIIDCGCEDPGACECDKNLTPCDYHAKYHHAVDDTFCDPREQLKFIRRQVLTGMHDLIVVDEASMLTEAEVNDLRSFGLPVLLVGDMGQLPPVRNKMNPYILNPTVTLTENHRQEDESGIPQAAEEARTSGKLSKVRYGSSCVVLSARSEEAGALIDRFRPDAKDAVILVQYNKTRAALNVYYHEKLSTGTEHVLVKGDRIISLERQEEVQELDQESNVIGETLLHNGTLATVTNVLSEGPRFILIEALLDFDWRGRPDVPVLLKVATEQFGRPDQLNYKSKPGGTLLADYAYALTAHKAQGSEFPDVIVWQETPGDRRWLYTALTRAARRLVVLM